MTRFVARALALIVAGWTTSAAAADLNYGSPYTVYQPLNAYSWAGPYLGGNVGYGWGSVENNPTQRPASSAACRPATTSRTAHPGCLVSKPISRARRPMIGSRPGNSPIRGSARCAAAPATPSTTCCSTRPAVSPLANFAARPSACRRRTPMRASPSRGAEMGFAPNWSAKIEYLYVDLANSNFTITGGASNGYSFSLVRAGINYHF